jgi:hypothetical protein
MKQLPARLRLCVLLGVLAVMLSGCLFPDSLSIFVDEFGGVFISIGNIDFAPCGSGPGTFNCEVALIASQGEMLSPGELFLLLLLDPLVMQLPAGATGIAGSYAHSGGTSGPLTITSGLASVPIDADRSLVAEPGTQLVIIGLPPGAPTTGTYSFNVNFQAPPGATSIQVKPIITGLAQLSLSGPTFYPPILPCVSDMAKAPALTIPLPVPGDTFTLPPLTANLGCHDVIYNFAPGGAVPQALVVDPVPLDVNSDGAPESDGNGVFEPGETVRVTPAWRNSGGGPLALTGTAVAFTGPASPGLTYTIADSAADYGSIPGGTTADCGANCYALALTSPATRPAQHWDAKFREPLSTGISHTRTLHIGDSFTDVPRANPFYRFIETIFHHDVTGGCGGTSYCPDGPTTREQMAVFLLRARDGGDYTPPPCTTAPFPDVPCASPFAAWVQELVARGITAGCGGGLYCPTSPVTREQMAVFLLKTREGAAFVPPACTTAAFTDVPCASPFAPWVQELVARGITAGCAATVYCPTDPVTRGQMAVFLTKTFGLILYGP